MNARWKLGVAFAPILIVAEAITLLMTGVTLSFVGWGLFVFVIVTVGFAILGFEMAKNDILATRIQEARARNIEKSGKFWRVFWTFTGHVKLKNGVILNKKHLYDPRAAETNSASAVFRDMSLNEVDPNKEFQPGDPVCYKVDTVRRYPQQRVKVKIKVGESPEGQPVYQDAVLERKHIFLDPNFNFMETSAGPKDLEYLYNHVYNRTDPSVLSTDPIYPLNFFERIERGFYYSIEINGTTHTEKISVEDVIARVNVSKFIQSEVAEVDQGGDQIWGGWNLMGFPWLYAPFRYHQAWISLLPTGEEERTNTKKAGMPRLVDILLSDDIYVIPINGAEDNRLLRLDIMLLIKLRIVDPRKAMYGTQKVLENVTAIAGAVYRRLVSRYAFEQIIGERNELGQSWWKLFQLEISDPVKEHFFDRYGIWILSSDLWKVDIHGSEKYHDEIQRIQVLNFKAEQEKKAAITEAEGKAEATRIYFQSIKEHGSDGLQILFMQTLEKLGAKDGKMIIPFGDIGRFLAGTIGKEKESALFGALASAGIEPNLITKVMTDMNAAKLATPPAPKIVKATR